MDTLTDNEVIAIFNLDPDVVDQEVERGILVAGSPPRFDLAAVVYLCTVSSPGFEPGSVEDRKRLHELIRAALAPPERPATVRLSEIAEVKIGSIVRDVEERIARFKRWRETIVIDPDILGGDPVFPNSRLDVEHIGALTLQGVPASEILEDWPYLTPDDLEFAQVYLAAYLEPRQPREREVSAG